MANVIGLSQEHEENLRKLADYLLSDNLEAEFSMDKFDGFGSYSGDSMKTICGTIGCAVGHGPYAGIEKISGESWYNYSIRQFGLKDGGHPLYWQWCFAEMWVNLDNSPQGAAKRILWLLDKGLPDNAGDQACKKVPLCYL